MINVKNKANVYVDFIRCPARNPIANPFAKLASIGYIPKIADPATIVSALI